MPLYNPPGQIGTATGTSLALGGATIGTDALAVTGTSTLTGNMTITGSGATTAVLSTSANSNALFQVSTNASLRGYVGWSTSNSGTLGLFDNSGNARFAWSSTSSGVSIGSGDSYGFCSTAAASSTKDLFLSRAGAASLQLGAADVDTAPVAQTIRTQGALAGGTSDVAGADATFIVSPGKGTGAGGRLIWQTAPAGSTGTAVNAATNALILTGQKLNVCANTATPAAGAAGAVLLFGTTAGFGIYYGSNAPTVSAAQGSLYLRSDGSSSSTRLYINTTGSTTWTNVTTAA